MDDLGDMVKKGEMNFDVVIASPDAMRVVGQLGQILGPRGGLKFQPVLDKALQMSRPQIIEVHTDSASHEQARRKLTQNFLRLWETVPDSLSIEKQMGD